MSQVEVKNRKGEEPEQRGEMETESKSLSLVGSVMGGLRTVAAAIFGSSANFLLSFFGSKVKVGALKSVDSKKGKRKRLGETRGDSNDEENDDQPGEELEQKRWRPDTVYESVQQFINNLLGEKDSSDTTDSRDENMNTNLSTLNIGQQNWNKRPDINFFSDSFVSSIHDIELEGDIKTTSTPQIFIEEEESSQNVFIFSAEKSDSPRKTSLSHSTFEEKQAYFREQIKMQEMKASESEKRSRSPSPPEKERTQ